LGPAHIYQGLVRKLERVNGLDDGVPLAAVDICHEALDTVHRVQRNHGLPLAECPEYTGGCSLSGTA